MKKLSYFLLLLPLLFAFGKKNKTVGLKNFVLIESGEVLLTKNNIDSSSPPKMIHVDEFYICKTELTNKEYRLFLKSLRSDGIDQKKYLPDTTVWRFPLSYNEPLVRQYFRNPMYDNYPVVGLARPHILEYIKWLNKINKNPKIEYTIPTSKQWKRAARGSTFDDYASGDHLNHFDGKYQNNFKQTADNKVTFNQKTSEYELVDGGSFNYMLDGYIYPAKTTAFKANKHGIYNMCGNVAEMVSEKDIALGGSWYDTGYDIRIDSEQSTDTANALIGVRIAANILK
ncbi:MAG: formylglycine-generating enzyme family protein [Bacteroidia bacterium]